LRATVTAHVAAGFEAAVARKRAPTKSRTRRDCSR